VAPTADDSVVAEMPPAIAMLAAARPVTGGFAMDGMPSIPPIAAASSVPEA